MRRLLATLITTSVFVHALWSGSAFAQAAPPTEVEALKQELRRMQDRLQRLEQSQQGNQAQGRDQVQEHDQVQGQSPAPGPPPAVLPLAAQAPPTVAPRPGEYQVQLEREHPLETVGLPKPEVAGVRISGFFVGSEIGRASCRERV